jgi:YVTN family beta-propeller protein
MSAEEGLLQTSKSRHDDLSFEPYIGPRPFRRDEKDQARFFGRDTESDEIIALITSHRITLVYAQSGAGKTSIFNAQVIPSLENYGFQVLPIARVQPTSAQISSKDDNNYVPSQIKNVYIYNALQSLRPEINAQSILDSSLFEFLDKEFQTYEEEDGEMRPQVLIFDQLEELFRSYPDNNWLEQQKGFFEQVADSLDNNPLLRVVFIIREDFLAQLDPFVTILPEKLRAHFRLEPLGRKEAILAIKSPLGKVLQNASEDERADIESEINALLSGLLKIYVEVPGGGIRQLEGEFVEPIQLQVVCRRWWHERQEASKTPGNKKSSLEDLGNVDNALQDFYEDAILTASKQTGIHESKIRIWCQKKLITSSGTRSMVHRGQNTTEGIDNNVIDWLERKYLIRKERRAGASWYELTHDGLIKPITSSNAKWETKKRKKNRKIIITSGLAVAAATIIIIAIWPYIYPAPSPVATLVIDQRIMPVDSIPTSIAINPNTNMIYVANYGSNTTSIINGTTNSVVSAIDVGDTPDSIAVNPNTNMIYLANFGSNTVSVIDGTTNMLATAAEEIDVNVGEDIAVNPNTNMIYVANSDSNTVSIINGTTNSVVSAIDVGDTPDSIAVNPNTNMIYLAKSDVDPVTSRDENGTVSVIDGTTNTLIVRDVRVGGGPADVAVNPDTNMVYTANPESNTASIINGTTNNIVAHIAVGNFPLSIAVNPNTNTIYVAKSGDNTLSVIAPTSAPSTVTLANNGISFYKSARYTEAIEIFDQCLSIDPNEVGCLYNKGLALDKLGKAAEANEYKNRAQEIDPTYTGGYISKGPPTTIIEEEAVEEEEEEGPVEVTQ